MSCFNEPKAYPKLHADVKGSHLKKSTSNTTLRISNNNFQNRKKRVINTSEPPLVNISNQTPNNTVRPKPKSTCNNMNNKINNINSNNAQIPTVVPPVKVNSITTNTPKPRPLVKLQTLQPQLLPQPQPQSQLPLPLPQPTQQLNQLPQLPSLQKQPLPALATPPAALAPLASLHDPLNGSIDSRPSSHGPAISLNTSASTSTTVLSILSDIETAILKSTMPIQIDETDEITVNGERGIWCNKSEVINWKGGDLPLSEYEVNEDPAPEVINKKITKQLEYIQELAIRYLRPPTPPPPGEVSHYFEFFLQEYLFHLI